MQRQGGAQKQCRDPCTARFLSSACEALNRVETRGLRPVSLPRNDGPAAFQRPVREGLVHHPRLSVADISLRFLEGGVRTAPRPEAVAVCAESRLPERGQRPVDGLLSQPVLHVRDAEAAVTPPLLALCCACKATRKGMTAGIAAKNAKNAKVLEGECPHEPLSAPCAELVFSLPRGFAAKKPWNNFRT